MSKSFFKVFLLFSFSSVFLFSGCTPLYEKKYYEACESPSVEGFEQYINEFKYESEAVEYLQRATNYIIRKEGLKSGDSINGYKNFLSKYPFEKYPNNPNVRIAKERLSYLIKYEELKPVVINLIESELYRLKIHNNTRTCLYNLLKHREKTETDEGSIGKKCFDAIIKDKGIKYLDEIKFAKRDIIMTETITISSSDYSFLGTSYTDGNFASVAKKGEILFEPRYNRLVGFVTHSNIFSEPSVPSDEEEALNRFENEEIYGDYSDFKRENNLSSDDLLTNEIPIELPQRYTPVKLVSTSSGVSGGLIGGISDFMEENPVASALLIGTAAYMLNNDDSSSSSYSGGSSSTSGRNDVAKEICKQTYKAAGKCSVDTGCAANCLWESNLDNIDFWNCVYQKISTGKSETIGGAKAQCIWEVPTN